MADPWMLVADYLRRWGAAPAGASFMTATSVLAPATRDGEPVMLKIATASEERRGNALMAWWAGRGAARVLEYDETAVLLERAIGTRSLATSAADGGAGDDDATRTLCAVAGRLHTIEDAPPTGAIGLDAWFADLFRHAEDIGGFHERAAVIARTLLADQREPVMLHGDLHHGNVLDFGARQHPETDGWLAIDPKHLIGDRAFDFTNILCNPSGTVATRAGRLSRQVDVICTAAELERERLLLWTIAWCGLSSAWTQRSARSRRYRRPPDDRSESAAAATVQVGEQAERLLEATAR